MSKEDNDLIMKKVGMDYLDQYNDLLKYVFQVTNSELTEVGWEDHEIKQEKRAVLEAAEVYAWFDKDRIVSQLSVYPMQVNIHGKIFDMGGITGVGTYPEYSSRGLVKKLMIEALKEMKEKGQTICYLYPYSIPYYRKKGFEIISDKMSFTIKDTQLPEKIEVDGVVRRVGLESEDIKIVYDKFSKKTHGALLRKDLEWSEYWRWELDEMVAAIYYDKDNNPNGYLFYWILNDIFYIKEILYLNQEARHGLWNFVNAHFSMIDEVKGKIYKNDSIAFLLQDSEILETIKTNYMARIIDVESFLENFPFASNTKTFHFEITDPLLEWNRGDFALIFEDNKVLVKREALGEKVKIDIGALTTMLMNYKNASYLNEIGRLEASESLIKQLEKIIPNNTPYFSDYF